MCCFHIWGHRGHCPKGGGGEKACQDGLILTMTTPKTTTMATPTTAITRTSTTTTIDIASDNGFFALWDLQLSTKLFLHNNMWLWSRFTSTVMYSDEISVRLESMKMFQYFWIRVVVSEKTMSNEGGFQENLAISATPLAPQTKPSAANWSVTTSLNVLFLNNIAIDGTDKKGKAQPGQKKIDHLGQNFEIN